MSRQLLPVAFMVPGGHSAERQLQRLVSVVSLVSEGVTRYSLILSDSRLVPSKASRFSP